MEPILIGMLALVGALGALNLIFTLGVVRRLRDHERELARLAEGGAGTGEVMAPAGDEITAFGVAATDGTQVSLDGLAGPALVGFFSVDCGPCRDLLPRFVDRAAGWPGGREQVLAVVVAADEAAEFVAALALAARVVVEAEQGPVATAFGVKGFPAFGVVDRARVLASGFSLDGLPVPVASMPEALPTSAP